MVSNNELLLVSGRQYITRYKFVPKLQIGGSGFSSGLEIQILEMDLLSKYVMLFQ